MVCVFTILAAAHHHPAHAHSLLVVGRHHLPHLLVQRLSLFDQFGHNGGDRVEFLVGGGVIHFDDEFVELCVLILRIGQKMASAGQKTKRFQADDELLRFLSSL